MQTPVLPYKSGVQGGILFTDMLSRMIHVRCSACCEVLCCLLLSVLVVGWYLPSGLFYSAYLVKVVECQILSEE